ncbi:hypothetical protein D9M73_75320 [compost metagenome]|jgi:hypothetical protein
MRTRWIDIDNPCPGRGVARPNLRDVCRFVRSKNAGPFWATIDPFFNSAHSFELYHDAPALSVGAIIDQMLAERLNPSLIIQLPRCR